MQDKPLLWSTFMMWLLAELYHNLPEAGDLPKPKLAFFFDEAHLLFDDASKAFLDQVQQVVRLIRSKGVGVYFVTQTPKDVPDDVLAQLSNRVQHALRAHTPDDDTALRATVRTFPKTAVLRSRGDAHLARHRRGGRDRARRPRLADAGGGDPADSARPRAWRRSRPRSCRRTSGSRICWRSTAQAVDRESAREMLAARMAKTQAPAPRRGAGRARAAGRGRRPGGEDRGAGGRRRARRRAVLHDRPHGRPRDRPRPVRPARRQAAARSTTTRRSRW